MNDFDQRWQKLARHADGLFDETLPELPFGFATRILARSRETAAESWEDIVSAFGRRTMIAALAVCLASAGFAYVRWYDAPIGPPALEQLASLDFPQP